MVQVQLQWAKEAHYFQKHPYYPLPRFGADCMWEEDYRWEDIYLPLLGIDYMGEEA